MCVCICVCICVHVYAFAGWIEFVLRVVVSGYARAVVSVEINKSLCAAARDNLAANEVHNAWVVAADSQVFASRVLRNMCWTLPEAEGGHTVHFQAVLVDPPRCGLDDVTCSLVALYDAIVYISCNPVALLRDLQKVRG